MPKNNKKKHKSTDKIKQQTREIVDFTDEVGVLARKYHFDGIAVAAINFNSTSAVAISGNKDKKRIARAVVENFTKMFLSDSELDLPHDSTADAERIMRKFIDGLIKAGLFSHENEDFTATGRSKIADALSEKIRSRATRVNNITAMRALNKAAGSPLSKQEFNILTNDYKKFCDELF